MGEFRLATTRLTLREWREEDVAPFHAMSIDPRVMEFLGPLRSLEETQASITRLKAEQNAHGFCFWAVERRDDKSMIGFCGFDPGSFGTPIEGRVEIGWRLAYDAWNKGYAREAAQATLDWGFANLADDTIWAITVPANIRSWGLMERLGMTRQIDMDFDHPAVPDDSPLKRHITYNIMRPQ